MGKADEVKYNEWKQKNKYFGKRFSVLGDSISTLEGYNPEGYNLFYTGEVCHKTRVCTREDTWWGQVIDFFAGELLVNNSWSGSRVTKVPERNGLFPSGCSDERTTALHINTDIPDVIIVYLGTNDWGFGVKPGITSEKESLEYDIFETAYREMLFKLKKNYPKAEIWCCTLNSTYMSISAAFTFPYEYAGIHVEVYNNHIREAAKLCQCNLIDLYAYQRPYDSIDGSHPNADGMKALAEMMIQALGGEEVKVFLGDKEKKSEETANIESEYVLVDPEQTLILLGGTIELYIESKDEKIRIEKNVIHAGRGVECDLHFENLMIARWHASFFYEQRMWYVRDNYSTNGVWLNGTRIQPGKKYQLCMNDVIDFAHAEQVIFFKIEKNTEPPKRKLFVKKEWIGTIILDKYRIEKLLGKGGISEVYQAESVGNKEKYTIKIISKVMIMGGLYDMLLQEATLQSELKHPGIPGICEVVNAEEEIMIVREYIEGVSLEAFMKTKEGPLPEEMVLDYALQIAWILRYLHTLQPAVVHRDIKPHNMMLTTNGKIKLIDFGIAKRCNPGDEPDVTILGTKGFAPPEQYEGMTDERSDIYALGVTMFYMLSKRNPGEPDFRIEPIRTINPSVSKGMEYIIQKCTKNLSKERYQTAEELIFDLEHCSELH